MSNIKHTKNYLIGSIAIKALGFISVPFFTYYLSVEEYGMMSLYTTVLSFLSTFFSLGVLGSFKRYYFEDKNNFGEFLYSNMIMLFLVDIIIMIILSCFLKTISNFLKIPDNLLIYAMIVSIFLMINKIKLDILQVKERSKDNIIFEFIQSFLILILAIIFILYLSDNKYLGKVYADIIGNSIMLSLIHI
jgi:O-antigen/teichoic acid export membrane protein